MTILHPKVKALIDSRKWTLSSIQSSSMEDLVSGFDRVLVSPTGSGKTEAQSFLWHPDSSQRIGMGYRYSTLHLSEH